MSEVANTYNRLGVGEVLICNKETKGKFEPLKYFIGKVILTIGGGGDKIYVVEDKDKVSSEVKSIQSRGFKDMMKSDPNFKPQLTTEDEEEAKAGPLKTEEEKQQEYFSNT